MTEPFLATFDLFLTLFESFLTLSEAIYGHFGTKIRSFWGDFDHIWVDPGSFCGRFGIVLATFGFVFLGLLRPKEVILRGFRPPPKKKAIINLILKRTLISIDP